MIAGDFTCACDPGWTGEGCDHGYCVNNCSGSGVCENSLDLDIPHCVCDADHFGDHCQYACINGTVDRANQICTCQPCYHGKECEKLCSGVGTCDNGTCDCGFDGRRGDYCDKLGCPGYDVDCTGHGTCNSASGNCVCNAGWKGAGCHLPDCPQECNLRGICNVNLTKPRCMECEKGYMGEACEIPCHGTQSPMDSGICVCDSYCQHGKSCDLTCNNQGTCVNNTCECTNGTGVNTGWWGDRCEEEDCPGLATPCSGHGNCLKSKTPMLCKCDAGFNGLGCEIPDCPGNPDCNGRGVCNNEAQCECDWGWMGLSCQYVCENGTATSTGNLFTCECDNCMTGTGCDQSCNSHGNCSDGGICECENGYWGKFCTCTVKPHLFGPHLFGLFTYADPCNVKQL